MTTVSEVIPEEGRQEGNSPVPESGPPGAGAHVRATSVAPSSSIARDAVTQCARATGRAVVRAVAVLEKPGSLAHSQPPTFAQARDRHHECARHYQAGLLRWPRYLWGWVHLLVVKPALNFAEWITESPARFFVAVILAAVIWVLR